MFRILFVLVINSFICDGRNYATLNNYNEFNDIQIIHVKLKTLKQDVANSFEYVNEVYDVLPNKPLNIYLDDYVVADIICSSQLYLTKFNEVYYDTKISVIKVTNVAEYMSDTWKCEITQKRWIYYTIKKYMYLEIRVVNAEPPQFLLVNQAILKTKRVQQGYTASYYYEEGDDVNIHCVSPNISCTVQMYKAGLNVTESSMYSVGLRINKLHAKLSHSILECKCSCPTSITNVEVTLIMEDIKSSMNLKIDGRTVRGFRHTRSSHYVYFNYAYFHNEDNLKVECYTDKYSYILELVTENPGLTMNQEYFDNITLTIKPTKVYTMKFGAYYKYGRRKYEYRQFFRIRFTPFLLHKITTAQDKPTKPPYSEDTTETDPGPNISTTEPNVTIVTEPVPVNYSSSTTSSPGDSTEYKEETFPWILVVAGLLTIIVLVGFFTAIYKLKKRNHRMQEAQNPLYGNLEGDNDTAIPAYPAQWGADPKDLIYDNINPNPDNSALYANTAMNNHNIYTNNQEIRDGFHRAGAEEDQDLYAKLEHIGPKNAYAQVLPKSMRNKITNDVGTGPNYVNSPGSQYVQPTYAEVKFM